MAVVFPFTAATLIARAGALAQKHALLAAEEVAFGQFCDTLGVTGLQGTGPELSATGDATDFLLHADYLKTLGLIFQGGAQQTPAFNFTSALAGYIGPNPQG